MADGLPEHADNSGPAPTSTDRAFGRVMACVSVLLALWLWRKPGPAAAVLLGLAAGLALVSQWAPAWLGPFNRGWALVGLALHRLVSPLALALVYLVAIVPVGLLLRLSGKDPMHRKFDPTAASYWVKRSPPGRADAQMRKQF